MSTPPIQITTDLASVLEQINQKLDTLQKEVSDFRTETNVAITSLKGDIKALDERLTGEIKTVNAKVEGLGKRLENQEFISRGVLIALIVAILGGFAKLFGFVGTP
jgi:hypothetical protein